MSEFRTGNKAKSHPYPATPRGDGALAFARNYASGPALDTPVSNAGVQIPWSNIAGGSVLGPNVPITPHVTGRVQVQGMVSLENTSSTPANTQLAIQINGVTTLVPANAQAFLPAAPAEGISSVVIPFSVALVLTVGVAVNIQILMDTDNDVSTVDIVAESSTIEIQEVTFAQ